MMFWEDTQVEKLFWAMPQGIMMSCQRVTLNPAGGVTGGPKMLYGMWSAIAFAIPLTILPLERLHGNPQYTKDKRQESRSDR
jgi:hypothetical protein